MDLMKSKRVNAITLRVAVISEIAVILWWWIAVWATGVVPIADKAHFVFEKFSVPLMLVAWPYSFFLDMVYAPIIFTGSLYLFLVAKSDAFKTFRGKLADKILSNISSDNREGLTGSWMFFDVVFVCVVLVILFRQIIEYGFFANYLFFCISCLVYCAWFLFVILLLLIARPIVNLFNWILAKNIFIKGE